MPPDEISLGLQAAILTLYGAGAAVWAMILKRIAQGGPVLRFMPRRATPWSWPHALAIAGGYFALQIAAGLLVAFQLHAGGQELDLESPQAVRMLLWTSAAANGLVVLGGVVFLRVATRSRPADLGVSAALLPADLAVGVLAFLAIAPPVFAMQWALTQLWPTEHPIVELMTAEASTATLWAATTAAVFAAPIAEEFLFRLVLQGTLERIVGARRGARRAVWPTAEDSIVDAVAITDGDPPAGDNPYRAPLSAAAEAGESTDLDEAPAGWAPIAITSLGFALLHLGHGPDPIPLFVFSLLVGYVFQRTRRILPCVIVHMLLNGCSMALLWLQTSR